MAPLLEREVHLARLHALRTSAAAGQGRLLLLGGEAGIGKTSLLRLFLSGLEPPARGAVVACDGGAMPDPLAPLFDLEATLGPAIPTLLSTRAPRSDIFHAVLSELRDADRPTVLVVEDAHWADEATVELLRHLGRRIASTSALVIVAYRSDEIGPAHPLQRLVGDLTGSPGVSRMELPRLSLVAVSALAASGTWDAGELLSLTGGNPFFLTEVVAAGEERLPASVRDAVLARAARLSPEARAVLDAAAVCGSPVDADLLEQVVGDDVVERLEECLRAGMLVAEHGTLEFRHAIARDAVLDAMSPLRRRALHRRALAALLSSPLRDTDPGQLAHHADHAGDAGATFTWAVTAGRRAAAFGAHREAAAQYERALRVAGGLAAGERMDLLEARSYECYLTGDLATAVTVREEVVRLAGEAGDVRRQGDATRWLSRFAWFSGDTGSARVRALEAHDLLARLPRGREFAMALSNLSQLAMLEHRLDEAIDWGERAVALARDLDAADVLVHALVNVGTSRYWRGEESGRHQLGRAVELGERLGLEDDTVRGFTNLAWCAWTGHDLDRAERSVDRGIAFAAAHDLVAMELYQRAAQAGMLLCRGRLADAAEKAQRLAQAPGAITATRIVALTCLGRVEALSRRRPGPILEEAWRLSRATGELQRLGPAAAARAESAWLAGGVPDRLVDDLAETHAMAVALDDPWQAGELALWLHRAGHPVAPGPVATPYAAELAGDWDSAAGEWERRGYPLEAARARASSGRPQELLRALDACDRLGSRADVVLITRSLRTLGVRHVPRGPRPTSRANPAGLTGREIEVLRVLAEGASDRAVAERLVLSPKTVGHHVSSILRKLAVSGRADAVERARALGLLQSGDDPAAI